jgi:16S rRNA (guanine966-N2)-methyltransferase
VRLRIITGEFKGRFIAAPKTELTRPTTDRVRESIFNYLSNKISFDGISVLDLYAGSGSLGLEALSRGAASAVFIEKNFTPEKTLRENIKSLGLDHRARVVKTSVVSFCKLQETPFDLIFADPPFFEDDIYDAIALVKERGLIADNGIMIIERSIQTLAKDAANIGTEPYKKIGDSCLYEITPH